MRRSRFKAPRVKKKRKENLVDGAVVNSKVRFTLQRPEWHRCKSPGRWSLWFPCSASRPCTSWGCRNRPGAGTGRSTSSWTPARTTFGVEGLLSFCVRAQRWWWWLTLMETDRLLLMLAFWSQPCFMMPPLWEHSDDVSWRTQTHDINEPSRVFQNRN